MNRTTIITAVLLLQGIYVVVSVLLLLLVSHKLTTKVPVRFHRTGCNNSGVEECLISVVTRGALLLLPIPLAVDDGFLRRC